MHLASAWIPTFAVCILTVLAFNILRFMYTTLRPKNYPPGPPTLPGIGNLHQIPLKRPFLQFTEWSKTYGSTLGLKASSSNIVVLNCPQAVHELLGKRAAQYSGRPNATIPMQDVYRQQGDKHIINLQDTPYLRKWRAAASYLVGPAGLKQVLPMQEATAATLAKQLLHTSPTNSFEYLKNWALATPLLAISGQHLEDRGKAFSDRFFKAQRLWVELLEPGNAPLLNMIPALRWLPERFASWKTDARYVREFMFEEYASYLKSAKIMYGNRATRNGNIGFRCLVTKILEDEGDENSGQKKEGGFTDDQLAYFAGGMVDAAVDTTWATILSLILHLAACPEVQKNAYEEIQRTSPNHMPHGDFIKDFPYLRACLFEVLRLFPPTPLGLPRTLNRDDAFGDFRIPKGTTVISNIWAIQRSPDDYDRPNEFVPERYLKHPLGLKPGADQSHRRVSYTFGAGRRMCPGEKFAQNSVLVAMVKLLWAFEIVATEPLDLSIETGFHNGLIMGPEPFKVDFILRDGKTREDVLRDFEACQSALSDSSL